mmetsp:Transcript_39092/g.93401  ORF Transcript_39092/g.93401 Transcript_39092/m.93401 type:complete len:294 (+) Transcript_39092:196-1077(+)
MFSLLVEDQTSLISSTARRRVRHRRRGWAHHRASKDSRAAMARGFLGIPGQRRGMPSFFRPRQPWTSPPWTNQWWRPSHSSGTPCSSPSSSNPFWTNPRSRPKGWLWAQAGACTSHSGRRSPLRKCTCTSGHRTWSARGSCRSRRTCSCPQCRAPARWCGPTCSPLAGSTSRPWRTCCPYKRTSPARTPNSERLRNRTSCRCPWCLCRKNQLPGAAPLPAHRRPCSPCSPSPPHRAPSHAPSRWSWRHVSAAPAAHSPRAGTGHRLAALAPRLPPQAESSAWSAWPRENLEVA